MFRLALCSILTVYLQFSLVLHCITVYVVFLAQDEPVHGFSESPGVTSRSSVISVRIATFSTFTAYQGLGYVCVSE